MHASTFKIIRKIQFEMIYLLQKTVMKECEIKSTNFGFQRKTSIIFFFFIKRTCTRGLISFICSIHLHFIIYILNLSFLSQFLQITHLTALFSVTSFGQFHESYLYDSHSIKLQGNGSIIIPTT